jgi:hypothetical protein
MKEIKMKRILILFTLFMSIVIAGILFFQWNGFIAGSAEESDISEVDQSFTIEHIGKVFFITQKVDFKTGNQEQITIDWPDDAQNYQCLDDEGESCLSKENGEFILQINREKHTANVTISYTLERQTSDGNLLLKEWYPALLTAIPMKTTINIIEKTSREAKWISGYKESKQEEMHFLDYYSFTGKGPPSDLLLYSGEMNLLENANTRVYSKEMAKFNFGDIGLKDEGFVTAVIDDRFPASETENFLIINGDISRSSLLQKVDWALEQQHNSASYQDSWLKELRANIIFKSSHGSPKTMNVFRDLQTGLTEDQFDSFRQLLLKEKGHILQAGQMDVLLKLATNLNSTYFQEISNTTEEIPFILKAPQTVLLNDKPLIDVDLIQYKQKELISLAELFKAIGIEYNFLQEDVIYAVKGGSSYRFYVNKDYFILNEENYGLLTKPVQKIGSTVFMEAEWLEKLFEVDIGRSSSQVEIQLSET